jgi:hypothetical protein
VCYDMYNAMRALTSFIRSFWVVFRVHRLALQVFAGLEFCIVWSIGISAGFVSWELLEV